MVQVLNVDSPSRLPAINDIAEMREPIVLANILVPQEHLGNVITLCELKRGEQKDMQFMGRQVSLSYELPMNEVVLDFLTGSSLSAADMRHWIITFSALNLQRWCGWTY